MGKFTVAFATKDTLVTSDFVGIVSAKNGTQKMLKAGWTAVRSGNVKAPVFTDFPMKEAEMSIDAGLCL